MPSSYLFVFIVGVGGLEPPRFIQSTDFKSGVSTDSTTLPKNSYSGSQVGGFKRQYSLKVIFISLSVKLQFLAAFGRFHFAANNISIDCRVSGLIFVTFDDFLIKIGRVINHKNLMGRFLPGIFFARFWKQKLIFPQRGDAYSITSGLASSRTKLTRSRNTSMLSKSSTCSLPWSEYIEIFQFNGSMTTLDRYSSIALFDYLYIIAPVGSLRCPHRPLQEVPHLYGLLVRYRSNQC